MHGNTYASYCDDNGQLDRGVRRRLTQTPLADVCGTYDMIYLQDPQEPDETRNGPYERDDFFTLAPSDPDKNDDALTPADIVGSFKTGVLSGEVVELRKTKEVVHSFCGIAPPRPAPGPDGYLTSAWQMFFEWDGGSGAGHVLTVGTVRDDNGNPFIEVTFLHKIFMDAAHTVSIIGKKRVESEEDEVEDGEEDNDEDVEREWDGEEEEVPDPVPRLSQAEMWRLGCGVDEEELEMRMEKRRVRMLEDRASDEDDEEEYGEVPDFGDEEDETESEEEIEGRVMSFVPTGRKRRAEDASQSSTPVKRRKNT